MVRIGRAYHADDAGFRLPVHFAHQVVPALVFHLQQVHAIEVPYNHVTLRLRAARTAMFSKGCIGLEALPARRGQV